MTDDVDYTLDAGDNCVATLSNNYYQTTCCRCATAAECDAVPP